MSVLFILKKVYSTTICLSLDLPRANRSLPHCPSARERESLRIMDFGKCFLGRDARRQRSRQSDAHLLRHLVYIQGIYTQNTYSTTSKTSSTVCNGTQAGRKSKIDSKKISFQITQSLRRRRRPLRTGRRH